MFLDFGSLHQKHRVGGPLIVCVVVHQMVCARRFSRATILGGEIVLRNQRPSHAGERLRDQRLSRHQSSPACHGQTAGITFQLSP